MARKPRSDSKLLTLPDEDQQKIFSLLKHVGYEKTRILVKKELSISTSVGALHNFWEYWCEKESKNRIIQAVTSAKETVEAAADHLPLLNQATQAALQQATFEAIMRGGDVKMVKDFSNILLKSRALDQAQEQLELRLRQYEDQMADALKAAESAERGGGLTPEALKEIKQALKM